MTENKNQTISPLQIIGQTYFGLDEKELREQQDVEGMIEYYIEHDYKKAKEIFERKENWFMLGVLYYYGRGVTRDLPRAKSYLEQAIENKNSAGLVNLSVLYDFGEGVTQDYIKVKQYYEQAVEQGNSDGLVGLGNVYCFGRGVPYDYTKAKQYYEQAVEQGNSNGLIFLGCLYYHGRGVVSNTITARSYWEKAVEQGNSLGLVKLGDLYYNGEGVKKSYAKAYFYWKQAKEQGNTQAHEKIDKIPEDKLIIYELREEYAKISKKLMEIETHLKYMPCGEGYYEAKLRFAESVERSSTSLDVKQSLTSFNEPQNTEELSLDYDL